MTAAPHRLGVATRLTRNATLGALLSLMLLLVLWYGWLAPPALSFWPVLLALFLVPLALPVKGMLRGTPRAHLEAALVALLYLGHGVMEIYGSPGARWLAAVEVALGLILFVAGLAYARLRRRELTAAP